MMEFTFEPAGSPWALALNRLKAGDTLSASRFLTLVRAAGEIPEEAAMELEELGVMLDVSDLPTPAVNPGTAARMELEAKLLAQGGRSETLDAKDPLRLFVEELELTPNPENEQKLVEDLLKNAPDAAGKLTRNCLSLVFDCAREFSGRGVLLMDLIQEGSLGLWQGVLNYAGGDFRGHAQWWIRQAMARIVTLQAEADGVGEHMAKRLEGYEQAEKELRRTLGRSPMDEELAVSLGITPEETRALGKMLGEVREMDKIHRENQPREETEEESQSVEDTAYYQTRERVSDLMSGLTELETTLLNLRYGLSGKAPLTLQETALKLNLTAAEAAELEASALAKMRGAQ
jgi:RNA polymerase primary sigma factor